MKSLTVSLLVLPATAILPLVASGQTHSSPIVCGQTYTVTRGDTLSGISVRAYGTKAFSDVYNANQAVIGSNPNLIVVGQQLDIPCPAGQEPPVVTAEAPQTEEVAEVAAAEQPAAPQEDAPSQAEPDIPISDSGEVVLTFNKASAPKFIINSGIIDLYLSEIEEVTAGRVQFIDPPVMNRDPEAQLDLVTSGQVDGAYVFNGYLSETHPLLQIPMLPLMGGSAEQTAVSLWRLHETYLSQTDYFSDAHLMGFVAAPAAHIWRLTEAPVAAGQEVFDKNDYAIPYFAGLDTRGPAVVREENARWLAKYDEAANGSLTFFLAHGAARAAGLWDDARTVTEVDYGMYTPTFSVVLSNEAWAQISQEDRAAIEEISGERLAARSASWDAFDNGHRQDMLETGLNVAKADADFLAELEGVRDAGLESWLNAADALGINGPEAVATYQQNLDALQDRLIFR